MITTLAAEASLFNPESLQSLLAASAEQHRHLCPRQVLGIRLGLYGLRLLGLLDETSGCFDNAHKRLLTIMETDGCGADGVAVATNCHVGRRTLRVVDYGKMAATLVDTQTDKAIRVAPTSQSRELAPLYALEARSRWHAYLEAYQVMPDELLFTWQPVEIFPSASELISRAGVRVDCASCGEEIINEREMVVNGRTLCRACAGDSYYSPVAQPTQRATPQSKSDRLTFERQREMNFG